MMGVLTGAFGVVSIVVVVSGVAKLMSPAPTADLLAALRLPNSTVIVRGFGSVEVVVGTAALLVGADVLAVVVAGLYVAFAAVVVAARRAGAASCGCFGATSAPPNVVHVVVNLASAGVAVAAAVTGATSVPDLLADQPAAGVPLLILMGTAAWLVVAIDTAGADLVDRMAELRRAVPAAGSTHADGSRS
jgi:Methylamine utilisation protein MauE